LQLTLEYGDDRVASSGTSGWFEDELAQVQRQLPQSVFIKACINCLFSDYSPSGHGLYGQMMCFRNIKTEYLQVKSKQDSSRFTGVRIVSYRRPTCVRSFREEFLERVIAGSFDPAAARYAIYVGCCHPKRKAL
jgi:hypothetical protein